MRLGAFGPRQRSVSSSSTYNVTSIKGSLQNAAILQVKWNAAPKSESCNCCHRQAVAVVFFNCHCHCHCPLPLPLPLRLLLLLPQTPDHEKTCSWTTGNYCTAAAAESAGATETKPNSRSTNHFGTNLCGTRHNFTEPKAAFWKFNGTPWFAVKVNDIAASCPMHLLASHMHRPYSSPGKYCQSAAHALQP